MDVSAAKVVPGNALQSVVRVGWIIVIVKDIDVPPGGRAVTIKGLVLLKHITVPWGNA
jgi:hypothetical protein